MARGILRVKGSRLLFFVCLVGVVFYSSFSLWANNKSVLTCSHPKVCELLKEMAPALNFRLDSTLKNLQGDPHHAQLTFGQLKGLIRADVLVTPSVHLQPWLKKILQKRKRAERPTLTLKVRSSHTKTQFTAKEKRIYSHFWLYPSQVKANLKSIQHFLKKELKAESVSTSELKKQCNSLEKTLKRALKKYQNSGASPIILTHDALWPLFERHSIESLSLSGSSHGEIFGPKEMKELTKLKQSSSTSPLTWIIENQIQAGEKVESFIRSKDYVLRINTSGFREKNDTLFGPLKKLITFLEKIGEKK